MKITSDPIEKMHGDPPSVGIGLGKALHPKHSRKWLKVGEKIELILLDIFH